MSAAIDRYLRFAARVKIEFVTPFIVGGEKEDLFFDDVFTADANGLPALPGSSLAGILRHAWVNAGNDDADDLFGFQDGDKGMGSRLSVSWGCIHDSDDQPVEGILFNREKLAQDCVLSEARMLNTRDHVRINHQGTGAKGGKFNEQSVSAGHRFTFELLLEGGPDDGEKWGKLLGLLNSDALYIGGKSRRGYGQFKVVALRGGQFDLTDKEDFNQFRAHPVSLKTCSLPDILDMAPLAPESAGVMATLRLKPESFWMIGGGTDPDVGMAPLKANRIVWTDGCGKVDYDKVIIPGSAIKGAIAHRVAFHYNRLKKRFADPTGDPCEVSGENNPAVKALFGYCKQKKNGGINESGRRGRVVIGDLFVENPGEQKIINHVAIDRFTGGARVLEGALFDEKPYYGGSGFTLQVFVTDHESIGEALIRKALDAALQDLAEGRLAIGAGANRGHGYFRAEKSEKWNAAGQSWIKGGAQ